MQSAKTSAYKTKLRTEIDIIRRRILARKKKVGVDIYALLVAKSQNDILQLPSALSGASGTIKEKLRDCQADVSAMMQEKTDLETDSTIRRVQNERAAPVSTMGDRMKLAGRWISNAGTEMSTQTQLLNLDRKMKIRKEQFGLEVWEAVASGSSSIIMTNDQVLGAAGAAVEGGAGMLGKIGNVGRNLTKGVSSYVKNLSKMEREIQACVDTAVNEVVAWEHDKAKKEREVENA